MSTSPHTEKAHQALSSLKELASTTDGWTFVQEKEGVKLYNKTVEGSPIPLVRGDIVVEGDQYTPQQLLAVCTFPGCRKIYFGYPPLCLDATATFKKESFDHGKREYTAELDGEGEAKWSYSKQMYPGGVKVHVSGNGSVEVVNHEIILKGVNGPATVTITKS
ncbi:hypothetical protein RMCBS344292_08792 [Rhizopus microsporus]|nr:hypothetical protein RMCBS344292_08792 [Rhizopus microsporus]